VTSPNQPRHIDPKHGIRFNMPSNTKESGTFSFTIDTGHGVADGVDVAYELSVNDKVRQKWSHTTNVYCGITVPVFGLEPGQENWIVFHMTKGGTRTEPSPKESLGGKGVVDFANFVLMSTRNSTCSVASCADGCMRLLYETCVIGNGRAAEIALKGVELAVHIVGTCAVRRTRRDGGTRRRPPLDQSQLFLHLLATVARPAGPGGARAVVAESVLVKHQLLILNRW
jgi:hypothetical protein